MEITLDTVVLLSIFKISLHSVFILSLLSLRNMCGVYFSLNLLSVKTNMYFVVQIQHLLNFRRSETHQYETDDFAMNKPVIFIIAMILWS